MKADIRNIYQLKAYIQTLKVLYLLMIVAYVKTLKSRENRENETADLSKVTPDGNYGGSTSIIIGIQAVDLTSVTPPPATASVGPTKELEFSDGTKPEKQYHLELQLAERLNPHHLTCDQIQGTSIKVVTDKGDLESIDGLYPVSADLTFENKDGKCRSKEKFIITNLPEGSIEQTDVVPIRGGIGNKIEVVSTDLLIEPEYTIPIEPVEVIVIGIDGLRQDVLYDQNEASYLDPNGCGNNISCNVPIDSTNLPGLSKIMTDSGTIKLKDVTAIFPSITLASWASIFTGKMPDETGILGNEFFARDLYESGWENIPGMRSHGIPEGMITLSDGAFSNSTIDFFVKNLMPAHDYAKTVSDKEKSSSAVQVLSKEILTIYDWIIIQALTDKIHLKYEDWDKCQMEDRKIGGDCRSAVFFNHYGRGADWWGTTDLSFLEKYLGMDWGLGESFRKVFGTPLKASRTLDETPTEEALYFLDEYSLKQKRRFPILFTLYYGGLDHYAHDIGMNGSAWDLTGIYSGYKEFFQKKTDSEIKKVVDKLKELDEFDDKVFIITADHGHTAMPTDLPSIPGDDGKLYEADTSCKLKLKKFDKANNQYPEKANNNLHIWELGEVFKSVGSIQGTAIRRKYNLLVPKEIEAIFVNESVPVEYRPTSTLYDADIVAAFNGPMAYIYSMIGTDNKTLGEIAEIFKLMLSYYPSDAHWLGFNDLDDYVEFQEETVGRLWKSIDKILIRKEDGTYYVFNGLDTNGYPITDGLDALTGSEYIEAKLRIKGMNNKNRSGDIVLIMKDKMNDSAIDRFTTGSACKSWHGSLNPSDSYVPFIFAYPGGNKTEIVNILKKDAMCSSDYSNCKGNWKLTDAVKEIIKEQYQ